ncbi:ATP-binding cassette domain-containing protein [Caldicellulosiruptoraceae bacterium PP1]
MLQKVLNELKYLYSRYYNDSSLRMTLFVYTLLYIFVYWMGTYLYSFFSKILMDNLHLRNTEKMMMLSSLWILIIIIMTLLLYIFPIYSIKSNYKVYYILLSKIFIKLIKTPFNVYISVFSNITDILQRMINDLNNIINASFRIVNSITGIVILLFVTIWGLIISPFVMIFLIICSIFQISVENILNNKIESSISNQRNLQTDTFQLLYNLIINTETLLINKAYFKLFELYKEKRRELWNVNKNIELIYFKKDVAINFISLFVDVGILVILYFLGIKNFISIFLASMFLFNVWKNSFSSFSNLLLILSQTKPFLRRLDNLMSYSFEDYDKLDVFFINGKEKNDNIIEMEKVYFEIGEREILKNVNLCIKKDEKIAIIGKNGSGKTTLLRCMMGLNTPTSGKIRLNGIEPLKIPVEERIKLLSYIPAQPQLFALTIKENINLGCNNDIDDNKLNELFDNMYLRDWILTLTNGIDSDLNVNAQNISGGQAQRLSIIRALIEDRIIVFADEPASMLDESMSQKVFDFIIEKSNTFVYVTHKIEQVMKADKIILVNNGEVSILNKDNDLINYLNTID